MVWVWGLRSSEPTYRQEEETTWTAGPAIRVAVGDTEVLTDDVRALRDLWEATSFELDRLQEMLEDRESDDMTQVDIGAAGIEPFLQT